MRSLILALSLFGSIAAAHTVPVATLKVDPRAISGNRAMLRSDLGITVTGAGVSTWANQTTGGASATQGTDASRPPYSSGGVNGRPRLTLDGVADHLLWTQDIDGAKTVALVLKPASNPGAAVYRVKLVLRSSTPKVSTWWNSGDANLKDFWGDDHTASAVAVNVETALGTNALLLLHTWDGVSVTATSSYAQRRNNVASTVAVAGGSIDPTGITTGMIGSWNGALYFFTGEYYEIEIWNRVLTASEQDVLWRGYYKMLYGL